MPARRLEHRRGAECWHLKTNLIEAAGYGYGAHVIVDTKGQPRAGNIVLAFRHDIPGDDPVPLFRLWYPPYLLTATRSPGEGLRDYFGTRPFTALARAL